MKKFFIVLVVLIVVGGSGYFVWSKYFSNPTTKNYSEPFMWGATLRPTGLNRYNESVWKKQLKIASELGIKWARIGWSYDAPDQFAFHDPIIQAITDYGIDTYLIIEPTGDFSKVEDPYYDGYTNGFQISSHYKGRIKYYQIMNEAGSNALKGPEFSGENESDYDADKYNRTKEWIRGASEGVKEGDPKAYRVLTSQWLQTGFLDKLKKDKIEYDLIGWNWFSDMGLMGEKKLENGTLLIDKLKSFNKPLILAEVNQRPDGKDGQEGQDEDAQVAFISKMAQWAVAQNLNGYYVLELFDTPNSGKGYTDYYGIYAVEKNNTGVYVPSQPRKAYDAYKEIISKYSGN